MAEAHSAEDVARGLRAIAAANGNLRQAARDTGFARTTLRAWLAGRLPRGVTGNEVERAVPEAGKEIARAFREVRDLYLEHLKRPEVVAKASAQQAAIVAAVAEDKAVRAEGGPTSISESRQFQVSLIAPDILRRPDLRVIEGRPSGERAMVQRGDASVPRALAADTHDLN